MTTIFFSYSHADENLRDMLEKHLAALKHQGLIDTWHDRRIAAGSKFANEISDKLDEADIILLLVSADFLASHYCYGIEMKRAMERHRERSARVIPVILRPCDWHETPFGTLLAAPKDGLAVRSWPDLDEAFLDIVKSIKSAIRQQTGGKTASPPAISATLTSATLPQPAALQPRSSNLRMRKTFSESDEEEYLEAAFEYMVAYFDNSLMELEARNRNVTAKFRRIDSNRFTGVIYREGQAVSRCKVVLGGMFGRGITYSANDRADDNSYNESLHIEKDDQKMYLKPLGMSSPTDQREAHLGHQGAAEFFWSILIRPLQ